jgi:hypothetical protein
MELTFSFFNFILVLAIFTVVVGAGRGNDEADVSAVYSAGVGRTHWLFAQD